jgi:hypothetical protein
VTVIALDVDGVLNHPVHAHRHHIVVPAAALPKHQWLRGGGDQDLSGVVAINPDHGRMITGWQKLGADVRWCTSWGEAANTAIAPLLRIDPLPVIPFWEAPWLIKEFLGTIKAWYLEENFPDVPLVWIDDMAQSGMRHRSAPTLVILVGREGLTAADKGKVTRFVKMHAVHRDIWTDRRQAMEE